MAETAKLPADEFFIGWLPMPRGYGRFLKPVVIALLLVSSAAAAGVAWLQRDPGKGTWLDDKVQTFHGVAYTSPYAVLRVPGDPVRTFLLVEDGKFGALPRVATFVQGRTEVVAVEVKGTILQREGRWMLALEEGDTGMRALTAEETSAIHLPNPPAPKVLAESITLHGEIIDPKCYLGAMKPGGGKTHKACAMRCVAGGIPPMLVTRDAERQETFYLLVTQEGGAANDAIFPFVGDLVEISGRLEQADDIFLLKVSPTQVRRQ